MLTTVLSLIVTFVIAVDIQIFPSILSRLGGSTVQAGLLLSSLFFLYPLASALSGHASNRLGKRGVISVGLLLVTAAFATAAPLASPWARIAAVLFFGAGCGILESQSSALLSDLHPGREREVLNLSQLFYCIGATGGPALIALILGMVPSIKAGWLLGAAAVLSALLLCGFLFLRDERSAAKAPAPLSLRDLLKDRQWRLLCVALFLYVAAEMGIAGWVAAYAREVLSMSEASAPLCLALYWGGVGVARILAGVIPMAGSPRAPRALLLSSVALTLLGQTTAFLSQRPALFLVALAVGGLGMGTVWPTLVGMAGARFRDSSGTAVGILIACGACAVPVVQPIIGLLAGQHVLGIRGALLSLSLPTLVNLFVVGRLCAGSRGRERIAGA